VFIRRLQKTGNGRGFLVSIPPAIVRKVGLERGSTLDIDFEGDQVIIRRVSDDDS